MRQVSFNTEVRSRIGALSGKIAGKIGSGVHTWCQIFARHNVAYYAMGIRTMDVGDELKQLFVAKRGPARYVASELTRGAQ